MPGPGTRSGKPLVRGHSSGGPAGGRGGAAATGSGRPLSGTVVGVNVAAARAIAERFALEGKIVSVVPLAGGHIDDSYRVDAQAGAASRAYVLQSLDRRVFPRSDLVMENVSRVTRHLSARLAT